MGQDINTHFTAERMIGYWHDQNLPEDIAEILKTWHQYGPDTVKIYDFAEARKFIDEHYGPRELNCFDACAIPAMQSDLFRVLEISKFGGFYLDLSIELLDRPSAFLDPAPELRLYRRWHGRIVNNMFAAQPNDPLLSIIQEKILSNIEARINNDVWQVTGPKVWNEVTDTGGLDEGITVFEHADIAGSIVRFRQDLAHKKNGNHWLDKQKKISIYNNPDQDI